ncbi:MAG: M3 family oligoendopeptidase [Candidatus Paceibacterota bacterium]|jgi:oligoendopeptidase F
MKTTWNLGLLYRGHDDPRIEKDIRSGERAFAAFEKKYKGKTDYLKNEARFLAALTEFEEMFRDLRLSGPVMYFHYVKDLDGSDVVAQARETQFSERYAKNDQRIAFFELSIAKIPVPLQRKFLASKKLAHFRYYLKTIFDRSKHNLSEAEEKIMRLKSIPAHDQWINATEKLLGKMTVDFKGKSIPLPEAGNMIGDLQLPDRRELHDSLMKTLGTIADVAEGELNAIATNKKINDELRGYKEAYDATILGYQNDRKSVLALVDVVTKNFHISHRFNRVKAQLLGLDRLSYADRNAGIEPEVKEVSFDEAVEILRDVFGSIHPRYLSILDGYLERGQIDVYPKKGKKGGAYCSGSLNLPTFVMLNYTNTLDQVSTFAHEMGHAIHTELSESQSPFYQDYSTSTAEVASTLFESFVFDALFEKMSDKEKVAALHNKINDDVCTIFRQIACFNFEAEMHEIVREKGGISTDELRELMNKHMASYLGPVFGLKPEDGNYFVSWGHLRRFFYVYSYAFGQLVSKALYANYKKDKKYLDKINAFMTAGGSDSPENIFKSAGIDVTKPDFWKAGLASIEADIERLEKLSAKR